MKIAVASGKGGTGKTLIATSLALSLEKAVLVDCDVEEPNAHLLVCPQWQLTRHVELPFPKVDLNKCSFCGECQRVCRFGAIAVLADQVLTFPELCHSCGACSLVCPSRAISEEKRKIGEIRFGIKNGLELIEGRLQVGEPMATPIIRELKRCSAKRDSIIIFDAPPGTSCPVIHTLRASDYALLVTEPTPFGLNDLVLAVGVTRELAIPAGLIINKAGIGDKKVYTYAQKQNLPILLEIPEERKIAEAYSRGKSLAEAFPEYKKIFLDLFEKINLQVKENVCKAVVSSER